MSTIKMEFAEMQALQKRIADLHQTTLAATTGHMQQMEMTLNHLAAIVPAFHEPGMTYLHTLRDRFHPFLEEHRALFVDDLQTLIKEGQQLHQDAVQSFASDAS